MTQILLTVTSSEEISAQVITPAALEIVVENNVGMPGPQGDTGPAGATGAQGSEGPQGIQGIPGETGATGPVGESGAAGIDGTNGTNGVDGVMADAPSDGLQYARKDAAWEEIVASSGIDATTDIDWTGFHTFSGVDWLTLGAQASIASDSVKLLFKGKDGGNQDGNYYMRADGGSFRFVGQLGANNTGTYFTLFDVNYRGEYTFNYNNTPWLSNSQFGIDFGDFSVNMAGSYLSLGQTGDKTKFKMASTLSSNYMQMNTDINTFEMTFGNTETFLKAYDNSSLDLYYNDIVKFRTISTGVHIYGGVEADGDITADDFIRNDGKNVLVDDGAGSVSGLVNVSMSGDVSVDSRDMNFDLHRVIAAGSISGGSSPSFDTEFGLASVTRTAAGTCEIVLDDSWADTDAARAKILPYVSGWTVLSQLIPVAVYMASTNTINILFLNGADPQVGVDPSNMHITVFRIGE